MAIGPKTIVVAALLVVVAACGAQQNPNVQPASVLGPTVQAEPVFNGKL